MIPVFLKMFLLYCIMNPKNVRRLTISVKLLIETFQNTFFFFKTGFLY